MSKFIYHNGVGINKKSINLFRCYAGNETYDVCFYKKGRENSLNLDVNYLNEKHIETFSFKSPDKRTWFLNLNFDCGESYIPQDLNYIDFAQISSKKLFEDFIEAVKIELNKNPNREMTEKYYNENSIHWINRLKKGF